MMSSRGEAPDALAIWGAVISDPKATKQRIEELQEAKKAHDASYSKLKTREAELDARKLDLDGRLDAAETQAKALDERAKAIEQQQAAMLSQEQVLAERAAALTAAEHEHAIKAKADAEEIKQVSIAVVVREKELDKLEQAQKDRIRVVEAKLEECAKREETLSRREEDLKARTAKLRDIIG